MKRTQLIDVAHAITLTLLALGWFALSVGIGYWLVTNV